MSEIQQPPQRERRLRRAATTAATRQVPEPDTAEGGDDQTTSARRWRLDNPAKWADVQVRQAMARGDFDDLPGAGKPIRGLGGTHDPQWWVKSLIEREQITGVGPPALTLRKEDAGLDARLDRENTASGVRRVVVEFNARVVAARRQLQGGPPVITATRDVEVEVARWETRRTERRALRRHRREQAVSVASGERAGRRWWVPASWLRRTS